MNEEEDYEEDYEPDCMDLAKDKWIDDHTFCCQICHTDLHHDKKKGWYCPHGHEQKGEPMCRMEIPDTRFDYLKCLDDHTRSQRKEA